MNTNQLAASIVYRKMIDEFGCVDAYPVIAHIAGLATHTVATIFGADRAPCQAVAGGIINNVLGAMLVSGDELIGVGCAPATWTQPANVVDAMLNNDAYALSLKIGELLSGHAGQIALIAIDMVRIAALTAVTSDDPTLLHRALSSCSGATAAMTDLVLNTRDGLANAALQQADKADGNSQSVADALAAITKRAGESHRRNSHA